ncbi:MAG: Flp pilus assembly protein CpaB [Chloroflexota bacterium]|nr:Flp pilus assembly protein CpaB [Chloroflexota bacterium]
MIRNHVLGGRSNKVVLFLALFLGLISAVLVFVYLSRSGGEEGAPSGTTKSVVVAATEISAGTRVTEDMVKVKAIAADAVLSEALTSTDAVVGRVARFPITADEQILGNRVAAGGIAVPKGEKLPLSYIVPEGKRAMSIKVEQVISAGGLVLPGDFVDVIMVANIKSDLPPPLDESHLAMTILQNVEVLAVDQEVSEVVPEGSGEGSASDGGDGSVAQRVPIERADPNPEATTVTLLVTPAQAQTLAMADEKATLRLALRSFGDEQQASVDAMSDFELVSLPVFESLIRTWLQLAPRIKEVQDLFQQ